MPWTPHTLGVAVAGTLVRTQSYLDRLEEENATLKRIVEVGISLRKGPVGALGSYALDQAVSNVMKKTGLDQKAAQMAVWLGTNGLAILSTSDPKEEEAHAAQEPAEATTLTQAGVTILGVGSVAAALRRTVPTEFMGPRQRVEIDGATKGSWSKDLQPKNIKPNTDYVVNGYTYRTDTGGRVSSAEGSINLQTATRNGYRQRQSGGSDRLETDQGGHLFASIFNGAGDAINLVPMDGVLNQRSWKQMENTLAAAAQAGAMSGQR